MKTSTDDNDNTGIYICVICFRVYSKRTTWPCMKCTGTMRCGWRRPQSIHTWTGWMMRRRVTWNNKLKWLGCAWFSFKRILMSRWESRYDWRKKDGAWLPESSMEEWFTDKRHSMLVMRSGKLMGFRCTIKLLISCKLCWYVFHKQKNHSAS